MNTTHVDRLRDQEWDERRDRIAAYKEQARLNEAAPDLLKALIELVERAEAEGNVDGLPEYDQARAAIAKARGGKR